MRGIMVRKIRKKGFLKSISENISDFKLFLFLGLFTIVIGATFYLLRKPQEIRQRAFGPSMEFGFNTHIIPSNPNLDISRFESNIDRLAQNGQKWVRFNLYDYDIATEAPGAVIPSPTPTNTPPPTINTVLGLSSNPIQWNTANLTIYDTAIDYALSKGLKIMLVTNTPAFAKNYSYDDYKSLTDVYYQFLANRYKGKVTVWQIFNEANVHDYKDYSPRTTLDSTYLANLSGVIAVAKNAIKSNDPNGLITTNVGGFPLNDTLANNWYQFFDAVKDTIDIVSLDMYPGSDLTEISHLSDRIDAFQSRYLKDVVVTETGLCTLAGSYTEADQQNYVTLYLNNMKLSSAKLLLLYEIMDENSQSTSCKDFFGIVKNDGTQKSSYQSIMGAMQPLSTPTRSLQPTDTPTPTPTTPMPTPNIATATPTPANQGYLHVIVLPPISATIRISSQKDGKIVLTATGGIDKAPLPTGNYYISFSYPKTTGLRTPKTTLFKIVKQITTNILGDFNTGKTSVTYQ